MLTKKNLKVGSLEKTKDLKPKQLIVREQVRSYTLSTGTVEGSTLEECGMVVEVMSLLSALGELRVDEAAELGWSLTSIPLSCWSPLSPFTSTALTCWTEMEVRATCWDWEPTGPTEAAKFIGLDQALIGGAGAGVIDNGTIILAMLVLLFTIKVPCKSENVKKL